MLIYIIRKILSFLLILFLLSLISMMIIYCSPNSSFGEFSIGQFVSFCYQQVSSHSISDHTLWHSLAKHALPTLEIALLVIFSSVIIGFPIGIMTGLSSHTARYTVKLVCLFFYSMPLIWLTISIVILTNNSILIAPPPYVQINDANVSILHILFIANPNQFHLLWLEIQQLFLPIFILTIQPCIITIQLISERVTLIANKNYIKAARIRENSSRKILFRHLLPNAIPKAIPLLSYNLTILLFSIMVIEILFARSGMGTWVLHAFYQKDYTVIALALFSCGALVSALSLLSELLIVMIYPTQSRGSYE